MGLALRIPAVVAVLLAGTLPLAAFDGPTQTTGDSKKATAGGNASKAAKPEGGDKGAATGKRMVAEGIKAYEAGKAAQAIRAFDTAIRTGGLVNQEMARALYYRGLAYRKRGKPGLAISDLTSAVWLKDGLSAAEREEAIKIRTAAYREAGIGDVPGASLSHGSQSGFVTQTTPTSGAAGPTGWQTAMTGPTGTASPAMTVVSTPPVPPSSTAPTAATTPAPAPAPAQSGSSSGGGISGFFNGITSLFGSGSASQETVTTASIASPATPVVPVASWNETTQVAATQPQQPAAPVQFAAPTVTRTAAPEPSPAPEPRPWTEQSVSRAATQTAAVAPPKQPQAPPAPAPVEAQSVSPATTQTAAVAPPKQPQAPPAPAASETQVAAVPQPAAAPEAPEDRPSAARAPSGKFRVQVAAVRSRSEAYALAVRLMSQHGNEIGARKPEVDEAVIGTMGTFYRVRLGPYASAKEPEELCGSLRSTGFDCLVVTQ